MPFGQGLNKSFSICQSLDASHSNSYALILAAHGLQEGRLHEFQFAPLSLTIRIALTILGNIPQRSGRPQPDGRCLDHVGLSVVSRCSTAMLYETSTGAAFVSVLQPTALNGLHRPT